MDDERRAFLYGPDLDLTGWDLDDPDQQSEAAVRSLRSDPATGTGTGTEIDAETGRDDAGASRLADTWRMILARQIDLDEPPETWLTARRLLATGLDRREVFDQLAIALSIVVEHVVLDEMDFDRDWYVDLLDALPLPSTTQVIDTAAAQIRAVPGIDRDTLLAAVADELAVDLEDDDVFEYVVGTVDAMGGADEEGPDRIVWLSGDRAVRAGDLTAGIVLTHRVTDAEKADGVLVATFDLAGFDFDALGPDQELRLPDGSTITERDADDETLWVGPDGWLDHVGAGALISVRLAADGTVELGVVDDAALDDRDDETEQLVARVRAACEREAQSDADVATLLAGTAGSGLPVPVDELVLALQLEDPDTFTAPRPPLVELCERAGLDRRRASVVTDVSVWQAAATVDRALQVHAAAADPVVAQRALTVLAISDAFAPTIGPGGGPVEADPASRPDVATLRDAIALLDDSGVFDLVASALFDDVDPDQPPAGPAFADAMLAAARPKHKGVASLLAAMSAEAQGDALRAERRVQEGHDADRNFGPLVDRLAWYAADRGDLDRALALWRTLPDGARVSAVRAFQPFAASAGATQGRNEPCACGSGRKYKQCHLGVAPELSTKQRLQLIRFKAVTFLERAASSRSRIDLMAVAVALAGDLDLTPGEIMGDRLVFDLTFIEGGWLGRFIEERGVLLPEAEVALAEAWLGADRAIYEVLGSGSGAGATLALRDLVTGEVAEIVDGDLNAEFEPGELVATRLIADGGTHLLTGATFTVEPGAAEATLAAFATHDPVAIATHVSTMA